MCRMFQGDPSACHSTLVPALLGLLEQILSHQLVPEYDHHSVPAPWFTAHILKLLTTLPEDHKRYVANSNSTLRSCYVTN